MQEVDLNGAVQTVLGSILNTRLTLLAGAGLSMAPPSLLPSAAQIAQRAKDKYDAQYGNSRAPLPTDIEQQAEFFFQNNELSTVYFRTLVDNHAFAGPSNPGHFAIADLLLIRGIQTAITTNVDVMIENAGCQLHGQISAGIDEAGVAIFSPEISPLLKIHGCRSIDAANMVWAPGQLNAAPVRDRINSSAQWLLNRLLDRDLLIVGYSTDWDYLNAVLASVLGSISPSRVIVVDPIDSLQFAQKAPELHSIGQKRPNDFLYVRASGADFLAALRKEFSKSFVRGVLHAGRNDFIEMGGQDSPALLEPPDIDNDNFWAMRRDLEGCLPNNPSLMRTPYPESLLGLTVLQLRARGAVSDGPYWLLDGARIRVLRASNLFLHRVVAAFQRETPPVTAPEIIIAVGAEARSLPEDIVRGGTQPTITRGVSGRWMTRQEAVQELAI